MKVFLAGPYADQESGTVVDPDLIRVAITNHRLASQSKTGRLAVGHGNIKTGDVLIFYPGLTPTEKQDITDWAKELIREYSDSERADERADSGGG